MLYDDTERQRLLHQLVQETDTIKTRIDTLYKEYNVIANLVTSRGTKERSKALSNVYRMKRAMHLLVSVNSILSLVHRDDK